jgi:hypothetical protein
MYKATAQQGQPGGPQAGPTPGAEAGPSASSEKKDEGVIDAEYVDVEPKK